MEEGRINGNEQKTELKEIRTQIIKLQKKRLGQKDKIAFAHYRISDLERIIEKIQARHQTKSRRTLEGTPARKNGKPTKSLSAVNHSALMVRKSSRPFSQEVISRLCLKKIPELHSSMSKHGGQILRTAYGRSSRCGLQQSIEGTILSQSSKPQTLEEATNIAHRLMDQIIKRNSVQETNDHKRNIDDI
ncbi:hypothetical protein Tco_0902022 [Tanacetum coccineum]